MAQRTLLSRIWYQGIRICLRFTAAIVYRIRVSGAQNIPPRGAVLLVANHQSHLDPPLIGCCSRRQMSYFARASLFRFAPFGWFIGSVGAVPVDIERSPLSGIRETLKRLKDDEMVLVFPEGSRTFDGEIQPFKPGFVALAIRSRATVLPVAIEGAFDAWPRKNRFPGLGRIHVHFGEPIHTDQMGKSDENELQELVEQKVRECQALLSARPVFAKRRSR